MVAMKMVHLASMSKISWDLSFSIMDMGLSAGSVTAVRFWLADQAAMSCIDPERRGQDRDNYIWVRDAQKNNLVVGSQARILYQDAAGRVRIALKFNEMVRNGEIGPVMLGRDHHDVSGTDSPFRETANIKDGSNVAADMATQCFAGNAARGMSLVALHNGGGVGIGKAINGGFGLVLDEIIKCPALGCYLRRGPPCLGRVIPFPQQLSLTGNTPVRAIPCLPGRRRAYRRSKRCFSGADRNPKGVKFMSTIFFMDNIAFISKYAAAHFSLIFTAVIIAAAVASGGVLVSAVKSWPIPFSIANTFTVYSWLYFLFGYNSRLRSGSQISFAGFGDLRAVGEECISGDQGCRQECD